MAVVLAFRIAIALTPVAYRLISTSTDVRGPGLGYAVGKIYNRLRDPDEDESFLSELLSADVGSPVSVALYSPPYQLRKMTLSWSRNFAGAPPEDYAMTTHHFLKLTSGTPDPVWDTSDYDDTMGLTADWWNALTGYFPPEVVLVGATFRADGPAFKPFGSELSPVLSTNLLNAPGTLSGQQMLPPQVAVTVTEVTGATFTVTDVGDSGVTQTRNRWGRFYLPGGVGGNVEAGRVGSLFADAIASSSKDWYNGMVAADLIPVVYSPTNGNAYSITDLHVDDIYDVIRSRRFRTATTRNSQHIDEP